MPSICLYFQVHQPLRLNEFTFFELGSNQSYFNNSLNEEIIRKVSGQCYLKTNETLFQLINAFGDKFKITLSISGIALEQFELYAPEVLQSFQKLVNTGNVELLAETYYHSLASLGSDDEFVAQIKLQESALKKYFDLVPKAFRNTELIYSDHIAQLVANLGYQVILCEGEEQTLFDQKPDFVYEASYAPIKVLPRNYKLTDDIAFRFSNQYYEEYPITPAKYAQWVKALQNECDVINLFMDYETFGEHQWADTGIFDFLKEFPKEIFENTNFDFKTVSEAANSYTSRGKLSVPNYTSWADTERNTSAWLQNTMQLEAFRRLYALKNLVLETNEVSVVDIWRKLQTSDHFYYMSTKHHNDGAVHAYFSPFKTPYDAYIYYSNVLSDFELKLGK